MNEFLYIAIPINIGTAKNIDEIKTIITNAIVHNQRLFEPLFGRIIDRGDARTSILDGSLQVTDIDITDSSGAAQVNFDSDFYAGCKDINSTDEHNACLNFEINEGEIIFDIELPPAWIIEN